jgi:cbb3-type cytochrome oxidase subunit 1
MPLLTRLFIKAGLLYLVVALLMGSLLLLQPVLNLPHSIAAFNPVYLHLFMVGWVTQLIIGIVFWMFPKFSREKPRGNEKLAWAVFFSLNAGLLLRAVGEPLTTLNPGAGAGWMLVLSAIFQWLAGIGFIANTWARVKER